jgi:hypothetical protein
MENSCIENISQTDLSFIFDLLGQDGMTKENILRKREGLNNRIQEIDMHAALKTNFLKQLLVRLGYKTIVMNRLDKLCIGMLSADNFILSNKARELAVNCAKLSQDEYQLLYSTTKSNSHQNPKFELGLQILRSLREDYPEGSLTSLNN